MRRALRRDSNEPLVVEALRAVGALVFRLNERDLPDLLVGYRGQWLLIEIKGAAGPKGGTKGRRLLPGQQAFHDQVRLRGLPVHVVRTVPGVLAAIGVACVSA